MSTGKDRIKLRKRATPRGPISLYLDINFEGKRQYKYLKLYLIPDPKTAADRQKNAKTLQLAESIKAKHQVEIQNKEFGFNSALGGEENFIDYFDKLTNDRKSSKGNFGNWDSALKHLKTFRGTGVRFKDVDAEFVTGFKKHLSTTIIGGGKRLSKNSQHSYFAKFTAALKQALQDRIILINPATGIESPKAENPQRNYLSIEEVRKLYKTDTKFPILKKAFIFSCLTGLRWSDINSLTWGQIQDHEGVARILFKQKKTNGQEYLDINAQALSLIGDRKGQEDRVFAGLKYSVWHNMELQRWVDRAEIKKEITFHCARHTFAVMMIGLGTEIFTVSKLLGHQDLKTTQIYAKVVDKAKQEAIAKIPDIGLDLA